MVGIAFTLLKEILLSIVGRVAFKAIAERFFTRFLIYSAVKLEEYSTNDVVDGFARDIQDSLRGKKLRAIDDIKTSEDSPIEG